MPSIDKDALIELAEAKARDAQLLLEHGCHSNAYYLAGYAVKIGLKAVIATEFQSDTLPDKNFVSRIFVHGIEQLVGLAGLSEDLKEGQAADTSFRANWALVADWSETSRYESVDATTATAMLKAILDEQNGVLTWLRTHW